MFRDLNKNGFSGFDQQIYHTDLRKICDQVILVFLLNCDLYSGKQTGFCAYHVTIFVAQFQVIISEHSQQSKLNSYFLFERLRNAYKPRCAFIGEFTSGNEPQLRIP